MTALSVTTANAEIGNAEPYYMAIGVDDDVIESGQQVRVSASCQDPAFTSSPVKSSALTSADLVRESGERPDTPLFAEATINDDAQPGNHRLSFVCAGEEVVGEFVIAGEQPTEEPTPPGEAPAPPVDAPAPPEAQVENKPKGGVDTGSLDPAAAATPSDDSRWLFVGAVPLLAAGGLATWAYRRRQQA